MRSTRARVALAGILLLTAAAVPAQTPAPAPAARTPRTPATPRAAAAPRPADAPRGAVPRAGIEALEAQLDRAIDRVSQPRPVALLGREAARGYRLPGYGVVFVLTPRTLPGPGGFDVLRPRHRVEYRRVRPHGEPEDQAEALERQVIVLQHETEQARRAAEQDMERIVNDVRVRLSGPGELQVEVGPVTAVAPQTPQAPPEAPAPPAAPVAAEAPPGAGPPAATPPIPAEPPLPPPPPWKFWFEDSAPRDPRTSEAVVGDVRRAIVEALESAPGSVPGLAPEEFVTVAVDFEPAGLFARRARPEKTLVVRARVRDLDARARGALAADELHRRVEVIEY